jgi:signal transduction histidine kinase
MRIREWLRPPHHLIVIFLCVAVVSTGALAWLAWQLLDQDRELARTRRQERLDTAADSLVASMQQRLAALQTLAATRIVGPGIPPGVAVVSIEPGGLTARPSGALIYRPAVPPRAEPHVFDEAERVEYQEHDQPAAARLYALLAQSQDSSVRAGALARLARVRRKSRRSDEALRAYADLDRVDDGSAFGLPAGLVARVGRIDAYAEGGRAALAAHERRALAADLTSGRWALSRSEYSTYMAIAAPNRAAVPLDPEATARADAVEWLWNNRASVEPAARRLQTQESGTALLVWQSSVDRLDVVVAGARFLASLCADATPNQDIHCGLTDSYDRLVGGQLPQGRVMTVRTAAASGLPWTVHVGPSDGDTLTAPPQRLWLFLALGSIAIVLAAGWYFIMRAITREVRVARLQTDFVAAVSHEFRSPLTSVGHIAELLATERLPPGPAVRQAYDVLVRDTDRLRRLVENLLDFGRLEAGGGYKRSLVDVSALACSVVEDFRSRAAAEGHEVRFSAPEEPLSVDADREAVCRALWNLLDNAVKYSPSCPSVWVDVARRGRDLVTIAIRDEGLGIPAHEQREIFDRFVRGAESKARRINGTGIGLAMVRQIVDAHHGDIEVASHLGQGSTFTIVLPAADERPQEPA